MPDPPNAFAPEFLDELGHRDGPGTASEASTNGPWRVVKVSPGWWGVLQEGAGAPQAVFEERELAVLAAALYPAVNREPLLILAREGERQGFALQALRGDRGLATVGWLTYYEAELVAALHVAEHLARTPAALAMVLEAAGETALRRAGAILVENVSRWQPPTDTVEVLADALKQELTPQLRAFVERCKEELGVKAEGEAAPGSERQGPDGKGSGEGDD